MIDFTKVEEQIAEGFISCQRHPSADLRILNYTSRTQFDWHWTPETKACRGLIVDSENWIVARPFEKFFTLDQLADTPLPLEPFEVFEKMDGSLGILYWCGAQPYIATRGSFVSDQAIRATQIFRTKRKGEFNRNLTYLFEIIYPENRIVVDYGNTSDLYLLAVIQTDTGRELCVDDFRDLGFPVVKRYDGITDFNALKRLEESNKEGFVVRFQSGFRVKVKFDEYKRLHKLITGINPRHIWEEMRNGRSLDALLDRVPDEYFQWVKTTERGLRERYEAIETEALSNYRNGFESRKDAAMYFKSRPHSHVLFAMMDNKDYRDYIWRAVRPEAAAAFRCDIDT